MSRTDYLGTDPLEAKNKYCRRLDQGYDFSKTDGLKFSIIF